MSQLMKAAIAKNKVFSFLLLVIYRYGLKNNSEDKSQTTYSKIKVGHVPTNKELIKNDMISFVHIDGHIGNFIAPCLSTSVASPVHIFVNFSSP